MSNLELGGSDWEKRAYELLAEGMHPDTDAAIEAREDRLTTQAATKEAYTDWFNQDLLPVHEQTWQLALGALVRYGQPLRYVRNDRYEGYSLSTGTMAIGEPHHAGLDAVVPALRVSVGGRKLDGSVYRAIAKSQERPLDDRRSKEAAKQVEAATQGGSVRAEAFIVSNNRKRLPSQGLKHNLLEVRYPRNWRQRQFRDLDDAPSFKQIRKLMHEAPDVSAHFTYFDTFQIPQDNYAVAEMNVPPPALFVPEDSLRGGGIEVLRRAQEAAQREIQRIATLGDMLLKVSGPLREAPAFQTEAR